MAIKANRINRAQLKSESLLGNLGILGQDLYTRVITVIPHIPTLTYGKMCHLAPTCTASGQPRLPDSSQARTVNKMIKMIEATVNHASP